MEFVESMYSFRFRMGSNKINRDVLRNQSGFLAFMIQLAYFLISFHFISNISWIKFLPLKKVLENGQSLKIYNIKYIEINLFQSKYSFFIRAVKLWKVFDCIIQIKISLESCSDLENLAKIYKNKLVQILRKSCLHLSKTKNL